LRTRWKSSAAGLILGVLVAGVASALVGPTYTSTMQFFVSTAESGSTSDAFQGNQFAQQRVASYTGLLTGDELANRIIDRLDLPLTADDVAGMIDATTVTGTVLIDVSVTDSSPQRAEQIAVALGREFPAMVSELETRGKDSGTPVDVQFTDRPGPAGAPSPPTRRSRTARCPSCAPSR